MLAASITTGISFNVFWEFSYVTVKRIVKQKRNQFTEMLVG